MTKPTPLAVFSEALYAQPPVVENRVQMLVDIESGKLEFIEFDANVYHFVENRNFMIFYERDLPKLAASYANMPFLRDHDWNNLDSRDGIILASRFEAGDFIQKIKLTTRKGMTDYVEGRIDRFSISWHFDDIDCSICGTSWFECTHNPGQKYKSNGKEAVCNLIYVNPKGKETSAVNAPAVEGTQILSQLSTIRSDPMLRKSLFCFSPDGDGGGDPHPVADAALNDRLQKNVEAMEAFLQVTDAQTIANEQMAKSNAILAQQCGILLNAALQTANLPEPTEKRIRAQYKDKVFEAAELQETIDGARAEISAIMGGGTVSDGGVRIRSMFSSDDVLQAAVDDMIGAPRAAGKETLQTGRLSGIKELYLGLTGDWNFHGGIFPSQRNPAFASTTLTFPYLVKNALNKAIVNAWDSLAEAYGWWEAFTTIEKFDSLNDVTWLVVGTIASLPKVLEGEEYTELQFGDAGEVSAFDKYGGYLGFTLEALDRDQTGKLRQAPKEIAFAARRNVSEQLAALFTMNSGAGPKCEDTGYAFNATALTTAGGHANLLTEALGATAIKAIRTAMYNQPMLVSPDNLGGGKKQAVYPKYLVHPEILSDTAYDLFRNEWLTTDNKHAKNINFHRCEPIVCPEFTDDTDYVSIAPKELFPSVMLGHRFGLAPEVFVAGNETDASVFENDESRIKVRHFLAKGLANWRAMIKSNVAG